MIIGYRKAADAIGVKPYAIHTAMKDSTVGDIENSDHAPKRVPGRGPTGWNWAWQDAAQVENWYASFTGKTVPRGKRSEKRVSKAGKDAIVGLKKARKVLGVSDNTIRRMFKKAEALGAELPGKSPVKGGWAYTWESKKHLLDWWDDCIEAADTAAVDEAEAAFYAPLAIVGIREAAAVLGITQAAFRRKLNSLSSESLPTKARTSEGAAANDYCWADEESLREWWGAVTRGDLQAPKSLDVAQPKILLSEEEMIQRLLGEGTTEALAELRDRLDTPEVRSIRAARGEDPSMPLGEMLVLVVSLGIGQWPE